MTRFWGHQDNPFPPDEELPIGCTANEYGSARIAFGAKRALIARSERMKIDRWIMRYRLSR